MRKLVNWLPVTYTLHFTLPFKQVKTLVKIADLTEQELKILFEKFSEVSRIDSLTGLYNRRYFWETFSKVWEQSIEHNFVVSLLMIDIDYFKKALSQQMVDFDEK